MTNKCIHCGSTELDYGTVKSSDHHLSYHSNQKPFAGVFGLFAPSGVYAIKSTLCLDCGYVHLFAEGNFKDLKSVKD